MTDENGREPFADHRAPAPIDPEAQLDPIAIPASQPGTVSPTVWLVGLAAVYTLYFAKTLLMPIVVAMLFSLLLGPLVTGLKRIYVPRTVSAVVIMAVLLGPFTLLVMQLTEPAQKWAKQLPDLSEQLTERLDEFTDSLQSERKSAPTTPSPPPAQAEEEEDRGFRLFGWFRGDKEEEPEPEPPPVVVEPPLEEDDQVSARIRQGGMEAVISVLSATPLVLAQLVTSVILILFLLIFGPNLFAAFVDVFPHARDKRMTIMLVREIQRELSRYILTVSIINSCLGLVTGGALWLYGVEDAMLWGALVGLANFAPYVGPILAMIILAIAGLVQYGPELAALMPVLIFFCINLVEAQFVTPIMLGRNMRLNPLVVMVWLILWGWMWGAVGVLLAVPLLVCLKLAAARMNILPDWVRVIETRA
ncbi:MULTISPECIES: AI-2E family transporter [Pseudomonas]|uniref:AI-2E family transporter n=1 Tax=Pseudomonas TaxID=286 RepID=UPI001238E891|nr:MULTISPECIES: AI-2E family transporter [Pseudomonas]QIB49758.1 AI-2E family transporter [Pseudomonas sp. OIL-1]